MKRLLRASMVALLSAAMLVACGGGGGGGSTPGTAYTVTYNGNGNTGGSVPTDSTNYEQGQTVTVLANTGNLAQTNFTFTGWNTQANGSGTTYTQAQTFSMGTANVTLYAKWTANPAYTVTYNGNGNTGGSVPTDSTNYEQGQTVTVLANTGNLAQTNFTFIGWNTQANGSGTTYTQAQTFSMGTANVTLYAKWTATPTYTVTYNGNGNTGGSVPIDTTNYEQGQTVTVLANTGNLVKSGFTFVGWNTQANGSGTFYSQGQTITMGTANVTLYAELVSTAIPTATGIISDTSQTTDYTSTFGEDADYTIHPPSFTDNGDGTITDNVTGLMWQKMYDTTAGTVNGGFSSMTWSQATSYCANLSLANLPGWRLPTKYELLMIMVDFDYTLGETILNPTYFPNARSVYSWSSTPDVGNAGYAWTVNNYYGNAASLNELDNTGEADTRCVRGTTTTPSYTDNGDGTITDNRTGLMWQKQVYGYSTGGIQSWEQALSYCTGLSLASHNDWRLPNIKELFSIIDDTTTNPALNPIFPIVAPGVLFYSPMYYSSTSLNFDTAWAIDITDGSIWRNGSVSKTGGADTRCVRGQ